MEKDLTKQSKYVSFPLTQREKDVLLLVKKGYTNKEIAQELYVTEFTVKSHVSSIFKKLNVPNRTRAILTAMQMDL
jgi:DNA-binding NarL/FixJ family response regulator